METITVRGRRADIDPDDIAVVIAGTTWLGWTSVRVTRRIDAIPNDFQLDLTEASGNDINDERIDAKPGDSIEVWAGRDRLLTGWLERYDASIDGRQHIVSLAGRGATCDLVDCSAIWPGQQIVYSSVLGVAQKLAEPYKVKINGASGPAVGGSGTIIPTTVAPFGATCWDIIEQLCRIAGLFAYELPDGSLRIAEGMPSARTSAIAQQQGIPLAAEQVPQAASGFAEGINVEAASVSMANDGRFSDYVVHRFSFDTLSDLGAFDIPSPKAVDPGVGRFRRRDIIMEQSVGMGVDNAEDRAQFEASLRWGRSRVVRITTDSWRDVKGKLYEPNSTARIDLPSLKVAGLTWLITNVTYRRDDSGTHADLELMHPLGFTRLQQLPAYNLPADVRALPPVGQP